MIAIDHAAIAKAIDACVDDRVLVFGSLPPAGKDLDLLARAPENERIEERLRRDGYVRSHALAARARWARFSGCEVSSVELVPAARWELPVAELAAMFADAEPLSGYAWLVRPAPHHQLLISARRVVGAGGRLDHKQAAKVAEALARDTRAWTMAQARAPAWRATSALALTRALQARNDARLIVLRARALAELCGRAAPTPEGRQALLRRTKIARRRPLIVAFSGIDGAGKSMQARALQQTLQALDVSSALIWPPAANVLFQMNPAVKRTLRAVLERTGRRREPQPAAGASGSGALRAHVHARVPKPPLRPQVTPQPGTQAPPAPEPHFAALPVQRAGLMYVLATLVALVQVLSLRRGARAARGVQVLIFDRYVLDSLVYVRHRWGEGRPLRWQCRLIRRLALAPAVSYLLEVEPATAYARKRDFPLENLRERAALYSEHWRALGVRRLDAERPPSELCEQIAGEVWNLVR